MITFAGRVRRQARVRGATGIGLERTQVLRIEKLTESRILIVDDRAENLAVLVAVLEFAGYGNIKCLGDSRQVLPLSWLITPRI